MPNTSPLNPHTLQSGTEERRDYGRYSSGISVAVRRSVLWGKRNKSNARGDIEAKTSKPNKPHRPKGSSDFPSQTPFHARLGNDSRAKPPTHHSSRAATQSASPCLRYACLSLYSPTGCDTRSAGLTESVECLWCRSYCRTGQCYPSPCVCGHPSFYETWKKASFSTRLAPSVSRQRTLAFDSSRSLLVDSGSWRLRWTANRLGRYDPVRTNVVYGTGILRTFLASLQGQSGRRHCQKAARRTAGSGAESTVANHSLEVAAEGTAGDHNAGQAAESTVVDHSFDVAADLGTRGIGSEEHHKRP